MNALLLSSDLMASSAADGAARRAGVELTVAGPGSAMASATEGQPYFIAIDLTAPIADLEALVASLRQASPGAKLLAYGPHVQEGRIAAARDAGCDFVISRGQFHKQFDELLRLHAPGGAGSAAGIWSIG